MIFYYFSKKRFVFVLIFTLSSCGVKEPRKEVGRIISEKEAKKIHLERQEEAAVKNRVVTKISNKKKAHLLSATPGPFSLSVLSEVSPVLPSGQANSIALDGNRAYVGYLTLGEKVGGGLDIFDITNESTPRLIDAYITPGIDINAVATQGENLYITGSQSKTESACLGKFLLEDNRLSAIGDVMPLESYTGVDMNIRGDSIFVTSGDKGGIQKISTFDLSVESYLGFKDVRGIEYRRGLFYIFAGSPAQLVALDENLEIQSWFPLHVQLTQEDKSHLHVGENVAFVAMNDRGFEAVCLETGEVLSQVTAFPGEDINTSPNYALGMVAYGRYIITASGDNGLQIYDAGETWDSPYCNGFEMTRLQKFQFSDGAPATHVALVGKTLFVTAGIKGLKILRLEGDF